MSWKSSFVGRNLAMEAVRVTEAAALAASTLLGRGDDQAADQAAVDAMKSALDEIAIDGVIHIGEGSKDEASKLYHGESVGTGDGPKMDLALEYGVGVLRSASDPGLAQLERLLAGSRLVIDAVLGTGRARPLEGAVRDVMLCLGACRGRGRVSTPRPPPRAPVPPAWRVPRPRRRRGRPRCPCCRGVRRRRRRPPGGGAHRL